MKSIITLLISLLGIQSFATVFQVGPTRTYKTPNEIYLSNVVQDGDVIEIDVQTYTGTDALAVWAKNNLVIRGVGGRPALNADGENIRQMGIWVLDGNNITIENIEFYGAQVPDMNGAGIRLAGNGMTVRNCYFHDNENGILTNNTYEGEILIEYSEFEGNGFEDGYSHNLYIGHTDKLTFRFNYSHHAKVGHNFKSRASENHILYNRIMDEETGLSSRIIDIPNGGFALVMGNILMQGTQAENQNAVGYGLEGFTETNNSFYFINNTLVNKRASCLFLHINNGAAAAVVVNNIFAGIGTLNTGTISEQSNNLIETSIAAVGFVDEQNYDYHLTSNSPAINAGKTMAAVNGISLTPTFEYVLDEASVQRPTNQTLDIGAYEYASPCGVTPCLKATVRE